MFKHITDMREADELWKCGLLYLASKCHDSSSGNPYPGSWILINDYKNNEDTMAPSVWKIDEGCDVFYGIQLED